MTLTNRKLLEIQQAFDVLMSARRADGASVKEYNKLSFRLLLTYKKLEPFFEARAQAARVLLSKEDEQGKQVAPSIKEVNDLLDIEVDGVPEIQPFVLEDFTAAEVDVSAKLLLALGPLFTAE